MKLIFVFFLMLFTACNGQRKMAMDPNQNNRNTPLTLVMQDDYSGAESSEILVVKDAKSLQRFFSKINRTRKPGLPVPTIDFTKEMVIIYCSGVRQDGDQPTVFLKEETQDRMLFGIQRDVSKKTTANRAETSPFSLYTLPLTEKKIVLDSL